MLCLLFIYAIIYLQGGEVMSNNELDNKFFSKNLKFLRKNPRRTQEELAQILEIPRTKIASWESGRNMPKTVKDYKRIADLFGINLHQLLYVDLSLEEIALSSNKENTNKITVYGKVCAGNGIEAFEDPIDEITNPYHRIKGEMFSLQVDGDSMNNVVNNGMYAIIQKQPLVKNGEIAVVLINNEVGMLKRFYRIDDMVILRPDSTNPNHKPLTFVGEEINSLKILGRYIGCVSPMENLL